MFKTKNVLFGLLLVVAVALSACGPAAPTNASVAITTGTPGTVTTPAHSTNNLSEFVPNDPLMCGSVHWDSLTACNDALGIATIKISDTMVYLAQVVASPNPVDQNGGTSLNFDVQVTDGNGNLLENPLCTYDGQNYSNPQNGPIQSIYRTEEHNVECDYKNTKITGVLHYFYSSPLGATLTSIAPTESFHADTPVPSATPAANGTATTALAAPCALA